MANLSFLTEGVVGHISLDKQAEARKQITESWERLGFTKGLDGYLKDTISTLFENQATMLRESTDAQNSGSFETVVFPLVRRVFSRLLANDIVSVQAMNLPVGKLFYWKPLTSERIWDETEMTGSHYGLMGHERLNRNTGETEKRYYLPDDVVCVDTTGNTPEITQYHKKSLYDMFYDDGLFDASKGKIHIKVGSIEFVTLDKSGNVVPAEKLQEAFDGTVRHALVAVKGFSNINAGRLIGPDGNEMDTESFLASLHVIAKKAIGGTAKDDVKFQADEQIHFRAIAQEYGKGLVRYGNICDAEGQLLLELDLTKPADGTEDGFKGIKSTSISALTESLEVAWAQYDSLELETEMGEVSFQLSDVTVSVEERKLRATWSPELAQDVAAFHNIDAEAELTAILSEQIAAEIDREILKDLRKSAPWQLKWDYNGWRRTKVVSTNYTQKDWNQTLMTKINQVSAQIHKATLRGGANFIVVSSELSAVLNDLEYFHVTDANSEAYTYSMGIEKLGSLQGRYDVFVDPYSPHNSLIMGHKGDSLLDTGYIYAPYIPMQLTPTIYNAANFAPVKGIITRYAKKMVNNRYYGAIVATGLQTWNISELR